MARMAGRVDQPVGAEFFESNAVGDRRLNRVFGADLFVAEPETFSGRRLERIKKYYSHSARSGLFGF